LVVAEVALALVLFLGAGLLLNSFIRLTSTELGFDHDQLLVVGISLADVRVSKYGNGEGQIPEVEVHERVMAAVEAIPGITGSSMASYFALPLQGWHMEVTVEDRHRPGAEVGLNARWGYVSPGYFGLMGIPVLAGRVFGPQDMSGQEDVAVVSESAAREFWPDADPLGKRLTWGHQDLDNEFDDLRDPPPRIYTVVGVVGDVPDQDLTTEDLTTIEPWRSVYAPTARVRFFDQPDAELVVRTGDPPAMVEAVRQAVLGVDEAEIEVTGVATMTDRFSQLRAQPRFYLFMLGSLAAVALVLVLSGV